jgi:hypothetical protein
LLPHHLHTVRPSPGGRDQAGPWLPGLSSQDFSKQTPTQAQCQRTTHTNTREGSDWSN